MENRIMQETVDPSMRFDTSGVFNHAGEDEYI
jgi:hypothetical protein